MGKICLKHGDLPSVPNALAVWLQYLPLKSDLEEAVVVNEQLCLFLERCAQRPRERANICSRGLVVLTAARRDMASMLGAANQHLSKVCEVMAYALNTAAATSATQAKMAQFLGQIKAQLPPDQLAQLVASVDQTVAGRLQAALQQM